MGPLLRSVGPVLDTVVSLPHFVRPRLGSEGPLLGSV